MPAPPCLQECLKRYDGSLCTDLGNVNVESCIKNICGFGPSDQGPYAGAYYHSICASGGYFPGNPGSFINIISNPPTAPDTNDMSAGGSNHVSDALELKP
ncbi:hypothetical protein MMC24_007379 [Lignoscripta atroalba]|nr:hypothetical protein [Lignoscripta atroalba]